MLINVTYDSSVAGAPAGFKSAVDAAVAFYESNFDTPGTVNITIGWGTAAGVTIPPGALGATVPDGFYFNYEEVRNALWADARTSAALTAAMSLPAQDPTNGGLFFMTSAEAKALGLFPPDAAGTDGTIVIDPTTAYTFDPNNRAVAGKVDLIGVLEHEIGHVLGRVSDLGTPVPGGDVLYGALDLFRYSAPGVLSPSATAAYFSIDGQHLLLPFNDPSNGGDADDWSINLTGDAFDAFGDVGVQEQVSSTDKTMLDVFGFHPHVAPPTTPAPTMPTLNNGADAYDGSLVPQGITVYFTGLLGYTLQGSMTNGGVIINATNSDGGSAINTRDNFTTVRNAVFTNTGSIMVTDSGYSTAYAFDLERGIGGRVDNSGLIQSVSTGGVAYGIDSNSVFDGFNNGASGVLRVWAKYFSRGVVFGYASAGGFNNAGLIEVYGDNATGDGYPGENDVTAVIGAHSFNNSGTIKAISGFEDTPSVGVLGFTGSQLTNSGAIIADYAIYDTGNSDLAIFNSGKLIGATALGSGNDQIHNTGIIAGNIYFGSSNNIYEGALGHLFGNIYLSGGSTNTVTLSGDGNTVYSSGGNDTITGGAGNDSFMLSRGTDHIDGGGGYNTLSMESAAGGYMVDLGAGTAVGAGTSSVANIQRVIGSTYADTLIAGNSAAFLMGGGGADILRGGAGADTLVAGPGGDTLTGNGGNDTFIYSAGDGQVVITDFRANGNDVLDIYGYATALSTVRQGADTLITLSGSDSILLKNVSSLPGGATVYNAGYYVPPPSSAPDYIFGSHPFHSEALYTYWFNLNYALKIYANEHITMDFGPPVNQNNYTPGYYAFSLGLDNSKPDPGIDNFGQISMVARGGGLYGISGAAEGSRFTNEAGASFTLTDTNGTVMGLYSQSGKSPDVVNAGNFTVTASGAFHEADGVYNWDSYFSFNNTATGTFTVTSNDSGAFGLNLNNGGTFRNDGQFSVYGGHVLAYGVWEDDFASFTDSITNNGTVTVTGGADSNPVGFFFRGIDYVSLAPASFINTGTITAKTAIQSIQTTPGFSPAQAPSLNIQNSGTINGDINLGGVISRVTNTGTINGNILIHDDYADSGFDYFPQLGLHYGPGQTIDLRGGHFNGSIEISPGAAGDVVIQDTIYTGTATTTVKIDGGQTHLAATITADPFGQTTVDYGMASSGASWSKNSDGSWTVSAGDHGTEILFNVTALHFTDRTVILPFNHPPVLTTSNKTIAVGATVALSSLFSVSDADGDALTRYQLWDATRDPNGGHFAINGVTQPAGTVIEVTAAQLTQATFVMGSVATNLQIRAFDGQLWSAGDTAAWAPFTVTPRVNHAPVVTTATVNTTPNQTLALSTLFSISDADGDTMTRYELWDATRDPGSGHFVVAGAVKAAGTIIDITASQFSQTSFVTGSLSDNLQIRAFDGAAWSAGDNDAWAPFTVAVPVDHPPVVTTSNRTMAPGNTVALSNLFNVIDADGDAITEYQLWDATRDPNAGHFVVNSVVQAAGTIIDITAAQLAQTTFVTGTVATNLQIRASDGVNWSAGDNAAWAPFAVSPPSNHPPVLTTSNISRLHGATLALSSLFSVSDVDSDTMTKYELWDATRDANSGHFVINGTPQAAGTIIDITAAQLAQTSFVTGSIGDNLQIRAFDGKDWSAGDNAAWAPFTITVSPNSAPVVTTATVNTTPGQTLALSGLFSLADADGDTMTRYELWDATRDANSGHFVINGAPQAAGTIIDITAAQLVQTSFVTGTVSDNLQIRAFDGYAWSAGDTTAWSPFTVSVPANHAPVVTTSNKPEPHGVTLALSSLFSVSDADSDAMTRYEMWDATRDASSGHFVINGAPQAAGTIIDITAAQLGQTSFVTGSVGDNLQIRAFDGRDWSAGDNDAWSPFTITVAPNSAPVLTTVDKNTTPGQSLTLASLFSVSDADGDTMTKYQLWDATRDANSGHFVVNGTPQAAGTVIDVTASQLSQTTFLTGTVSDSLQIRAFDGYAWSAGDTAAWAPFHINV